MPNTRFLPTLLVVCLVTAASPAVAAEPAANKGRVNLLIVGQQGAPITSFQTWGKELGTAGIGNVRIRSGKSGDTVGIVKRGSKEWPVFDVTGMIDSQGDLILPGGRFSPGEARQVAQWLDELANPPQASKPRGGKTAFDLSEAAFLQMTADLEKMVNFSTLGQSRAAVVEKIGKRLSLPLKIDAAADRQISDEKLTDELVGFSCGTVLAYVLRLDGLCFVPRQAMGGTISYRVMAPTNTDPALWSVAIKKSGGRGGTMIAWPVGWMPEEHWQQLTPTLYEFHSVAVEGAPLDAVLQSVSKNIKLPILIDHVGLAQYNIDLAKIPISFPSARITYGIFMKRVLGKFTMRYDVRADEAGRPFIWVTSAMRLPRPTAKK